MTDTTAAPTVVVEPEVEAAPAVVETPAAPAAEAAPESAPAPQPAPESFFSRSKRRASEILAGAANVVVGLGKAAGEIVGTAFRAVTGFVDGLVEAGHVSRLEEYVLGIVVAVLLLTAGYAAFEHEHIAALNAQNELITVERDNALAATAKMSADTANAVAIADAEAAAAEQRATDVEAQHAAIAAAPASDDGPMAPVLRRTVGSGRHKGAVK